MNATRSYEVSASARSQPGTARQEPGHSLAPKFRNQQWLLVKFGGFGTQLACATKLDDGDYSGHKFRAKTKRWTFRTQYIKAAEVVRALTNEEAAQIHKGITP